MEDAPDLLLQIARVRMSNSLDTFYKTLWYLLSDIYTDILHGHPLAGPLRDRQFKNMLLTENWEQYLDGNAHTCTAKKDNFSLSMWTTNNGRNDETPETCVGQVEENVDFEEPTPLLNQVYLGCKQRECKTNRKIVEESLQLLGSLLSAGTVKPMLRSDPKATIFRGVPHGRTCEEMRRKILRICEREDRTIERSPHHLFWWPSFFYKERSRDSSRTVKKYARRLYRHGFIWHASADQIFYGKSYDEVEQSLWQRQYCLVGNTASQCKLGLFAWCWFCGWLGRFNINVRRCSVFFWKPCSSWVFLIDCCSSENYWSRRQFVGRWSASKWNSCIRLVGHCNWCVGTTSTGQPDATPKK